MPTTDKHTLVCCDCGTTTPRTGNSQKRCPECKKKESARIRNEWGKKRYAALAAAAKGNGITTEATESTEAHRGKQFFGKNTPKPTPPSPCTSVPSVVKPVSSAAPGHTEHQLGTSVPPGLPVDIVQVRAGLCAISGRHGLIAQRALAADTALAQLQEAMG